ncbi:tRNA A64-2'-O-ribosylphosphate transferase [Entophlyctis helioformis]|nr:tRNA A64-2'-O-ribosylphosphate transferase [Entophlyctis helioformis]
MLQSNTRRGRDQVRKDTKSILNRLRSIQHDAGFVEYVARWMPSLPVVPNERAGTWYVHPSLRMHGQSVYFKSTDGHFGKWDFNLRRLNYHILAFIAQHGGCIIVDITRKGKRFPDAMAKTIPLWCAVINRAIAKHQLGKDPADAQHTASGAASADRLEGHQAKWDLRLHCPLSVSESEHSQMSALVDGFADKLIASFVDVSAIAAMITKPLRPLWITPVTRMFMASEAGRPLWTDPKTELDFIPIVCLSASMDPLHMDTDDIPVMPVGSGFEYVQGAADDSELWAPGLTSALFWDHVDGLDLQNTTAAACEQDVLSLIKSASAAGNDKDDCIASGESSKEHFQWIVGTGIAVGSFHAAAPPACWECFDVIINCGAREFDSNMQHRDGKQGKLYVYLDIPEGKKGQNQLFACIPTVIESVSGKWMQPGRRILVHCMQGKDRSVGICLALLLKFMDSDGTMTKDGQPCQGVLDKETIRNRLLQIQQSRPLASPSRATLKKINLYFLGREAE